MKPIVLINSDKLAKVDDKDYERLIKWNWSIVKHGNVHYVVRAEKIGYKKQKHIYLHREVLNISDSKTIVDHKDHDGLNCQRNNLRTCTIAQNAWNQRKRSGVTSKHKGVSWCRRAKKWRAYIGVNKKVIHLGWHNTENEAAIAYNKVVVTHYGEFAILNKIL